jgi:8-oxo-dGTP pyrophosphatase MutT (NUDIX family)
MSTPELRRAATVVVARDSPRGPEVLMLRRHVRLDFVGDAYVFPGGAVDADDADIEAIDISSEEADARLSTTRGRAFFVAAVREIFEESGLLLATQAGRALSAADLSSLADDREKLNARDVAFRDLIVERDLHLLARDLIFFAHWVTPVGPPRRYDTRFFMVEAPLDQIASHDGEETVSSLWVTPTEALERHYRGELEMIFPTIRTLTELATFDSVAQMRSVFRARRDIPRREPVLIERDGDIVPVLPDES